MSSESTVVRRSAALVSHLERFPEDLRDIRRLQRQFALTTVEVAAALDAWRKVRPESLRLEDLLQH
ncbi:MAG: hypothetical protein U0842_18385 [Candidatus Binatia bacterium]